VSLSESSVLKVAFVFESPVLTYSSFDARSNSSGHYTPTMASTNQSPSSISSELTEDDLEFELAPAGQCFRRPFFDCAFYFLACSYRSEDEDEWKKHCSQHIEGHELPNELECFLCSEFVARSNGNTTAWNQILDHIVTQHGSGHNVTRSTPPHSIVRFLEKQITSPQINTGEEDPQPAFAHAKSDVHCQKGGVYQPTRQSSGAPQTRSDGQMSEESSFNSTHSASKEREGVENMETGFSNGENRILSSCANHSTTVQNRSKAKYNHCGFPETNTFTDALAFSSTDLDHDNDELPNSYCVEPDTLAESTSATESEYNSDEEDTDEDDDYYSSSEEDRTSQIVQSILNMDFGPALDANKQRIIERTLSSLAFVLPTTPTSVRSCTGTESSSGSQQRGLGNKSTRSSGVGRSGLEGPGKSGKVPQGDGDEEGDAPHEQIPARKISLSNGPKLACPFYKRDPEKYSQNRSCVGPGWDSVHRLKQVANLVYRIFTN
jgi:hypothetical protein